MVLTPSMMSQLGKKAPDFNLKDVRTEKNVALRDVAGSKGLLVGFICKHCPYVKHIEGELASLGRDYIDSGIGIVAISSNDAKNYPEDGPKQLRKMAEELQFDFPFLFDEDQSTAKAYQAACTPDFFLFDSQLKLVYRGQLDESRPGNDEPVTGEDLRQAMNALLEGRPIAEDQKPSVGCNIKWKPAGEPEYVKG